MPSKYLGQDHSANYHYPTQNNGQQYINGYSPQNPIYEDPEKRNYSSPPSGSSSRRSSAGNVLMDLSSPAGGLGFSSLNLSSGSRVEAGNAHERGQERGMGQAGRVRSRWKSKVVIMLGLRFGWIVLVIWYEVGVVSLPCVFLSRPSRSLQRHILTVSCWRCH